MALNQNGGAALKDTFWCSLHHQKETQVQRVLQFMDGQLVKRYSRWLNENVALIFLLDCTT